MAAVGLKGSLALSLVLYFLYSVTAAPLDEVSSHALSEAIPDGRGCFYNFQHYDEGDRIATNEPCLNCTCHNRMLMCYLRVCPFTKAIGQNCTVEKKPDQCCPLITCPEVPVALLTSSTTSETPPTTTALGRLDTYGCILEDNTFYADGAQVPSDPRKPCELCYCIRNHTACVFQECTLNVEGCKPVYQEGVCCPVRYDCDYDDVATTPKPTMGLLTTPMGPTDCDFKGKIYHDGDLMLDEDYPCENCYCMRGNIICTLQRCGKPLEGTNCVPMEPTRGQCCPNYKCSNGTDENLEKDILPTTERLPESSTIIESDENKMHDSNEETSIEDSSNESSEESHEESKPEEAHSNNKNQETYSTDSTEQSSTSDESLILSQQVTKESEVNEIVTTEIPTQDNVQQPGDSISEATQEQDVTQIQETTKTPDDNKELEATHLQGTQPPVQETTTNQEVIPEQEGTTQKQAVNQEQVIVSEHTQSPLETEKDLQQSNVIPESTPQEQSEVTTELPAIEVPRIPGEGSCLFEGKTYAHNTFITPQNPCHETCKCYSSIVKCELKKCLPPPTESEHCREVTPPGSCCPTYMCDQKPSAAPESESQIVDQSADASHEGNHHSVQLPEEQAITTQSSAENENKDMITSVIEEIPSENFITGSQEHGTPVRHPEENIPESSVQTTEQTVTQEYSNEDENVNSHVVHNMDVAIHEGQLDSIDNKQELGGGPHPLDYTTISPVDTNINEGESQEPETGDRNTHPAFQTEEPDNKETDASQPPNEELSHTIDDATNQSPSGEYSNNAQETSDSASPNQDKEHSESLETTNNYITEETTAHQEVQDNSDYNVPTTTNPQSGENHGAASGDSHFDETKNNENPVTENLHESSPSHESGDDSHTQKYDETTINPTEILEDTPEDGIHSADDNSEQNQTDDQETTSSQQNIDLPITTELPHENEELSSSTGNQGPNGLIDENPSSSTEIPLPEIIKHHDEDTNDQNQNLSSSGNEKTEAPDFSGEISQIPTTFSPEEASGNDSSFDKSTETVINQDSNEISHENEEKFVQTTTKYTYQEETEAQEQITDLSSSTGTAEVSTTLNPIKNDHTNAEKEEEITENTTINKNQILTDSTSETTIFTGETQAGENSSFENEKVVVEHATKENLSETSTEVKSEESFTNKPNLITESTGSQTENDNTSPHKVIEETSHEVIFEEVTVTGMPSIESHVTEGASDHSVEHINSLLDRDNIHTTESTKIPSIINEVQDTQKPSIDEVMHESTEKISHEPGSEGIQNHDKIPFTETPSIKPETSTDLLSGEVTSKPTSPFPEMTPQEEVTSIGEKLHEVHEPDSATTITPQQTTIISETNVKDDVSENLNQIASDITTEKSDSTQNEIIIPVTDEKSHEDAPPNNDVPSLSYEDSHTESTNVHTESTNEVSQSESTEISPTETVSTVAHLEPIAEVDSEKNMVHETQTNIPSENSAEPTNSEVQPETETPLQEEIGNINNVISTETTPNIEENPPVVLVTDNEAHHTSEAVQSNQDTIVQHITETSEQPEAEKLPGDSVPTTEFTETHKESEVEVTTHEVQQSSTSEPEVPPTDHKENQAVLSEHIQESQTEQNPTTPAVTKDSESSTSHESIEEHSDEIQTTNDNKEESTATPQIIHSEHIVPTAPHSDSHILENSDSVGEATTEATKETTTQENNEQAQSNDQNEGILNEVPTHQIETDQTEKTKPLDEKDSQLLATQVPNVNESPAGTTENEASHVHTDSNDDSTTQRPLEDPSNTHNPQSSEHQSILAENNQTTEPAAITLKPETTEGTKKPEDIISDSDNSASLPTSSDKLQENVSSPDHVTDQILETQNVSQSTETAFMNEIPSSTHKPSYAQPDESPSFPTWSQKPFEHHTTPEPHQPEENHYPSGFDPEYEDEEGVSYGPGTCRYGGKVYLSAQQIPRDDPCDFCFCFRSDIICLQQSCPPPIRGCYQETIKGFCCPRYECHVSMATMLNITTTTTTTTTTLPPHFFAHAYNGAATKAGCQVKDVAYSVGERIPSTSGPCLECRCGANGQMKCDPTVCGPQEALLRQVMDAAVSRRR